MYNVDCIGLEAVSKMIAQTNLKRFIIFRQGAGKGSTPVYNCEHTNNNATALKCFRDWAGNVMSFGNNSGMSYDILLYNNEQDVDDVTKKGKIRFSFCLSGVPSFQQQQQQPPQQSFGLDIEKQIQDGIERAVLKIENERLRKELEELQSDDDDDDEKPDLMDKVAGIITALSGNHAAMAGDNELDHIAMVEEKIKRKFTPEQIAQKTANQQKALAILWNKNSNLDQDLLRLAKLSQSNFILFKMMIGKLREMQKLD